MHRIGGQMSRIRGRLVYKKSDGFHHLNLNVNIPIQFPSDIQPPNIPTHIQQMLQQMQQNLEEQIRHMVAEQLRNSMPVEVVNINNVKMHWKSSNRYRLVHYEEVIINTCVFLKAVCGRRFFLFLARFDPHVNRFQDNV